jgi:hypothetical protein
MLDKKMMLSYLNGVIAESNRKYGKKEAMCNKTPKLKEQYGMLDTEKVPEIDKNPKYNPTIEKADGTVVRREEKKVPNPFYHKHFGLNPDAAEGSSNAYPLRGDQNRESFRKIKQEPPTAN